MPIRKNLSIRKNFAYKEESARRTQSFLDTVLIDVHHITSAS